MKSLTLTFKQVTGSAIIQMFSVFDKVRSNTSIQITPDRKGFIVTKKSKEEIVDFDFNEKPLLKKIIDAIQSKKPSISLSEPETELFYKCLHAAYYYIHETSTETELKKNRFFLEFYEEIIRQRDGKE